MNTETITDTSQNKTQWWIKFNQETGKILRISPKQLSESDGCPVVATDNIICKEITAGNIAIRDCGMIWDFSRDTWDIDRKSDVLTLREFGSRLTKIPEADRFSCDIFTCVYKKQNVIEVIVNTHSIKNSMNLSDINQIANTNHALLNLYFCKKNDPDYLIATVVVDPIILFKNKAMKFKLDKVTKYADWDSISIFTRPIFKTYGFEIQDKFIESDHSRNVKTILQHAVTAEDAHLYLSVNHNRVSLSSTINNEQDYLIAGQKNLKFIVCDSTIDSVVGGFGVSSEDIINKGKIDIDINFQWPDNPLVVYKNKQILVSYVGVNNG